MNHWEVNLFGIFIRDSLSRGTEDGEVIAVLGEDYCVKVKPRASCPNAVIDYPDCDANMVNSKDGFKHNYQLSHARIITFLISPFVIIKKDSVTCPHLKSFVVTPVMIVRAVGCSEDCAVVSYDRFFGTYYKGYMKLLWEQN